jgi:hypothetical protein
MGVGEGNREQGTGTSISVIATSKNVVLGISGALFSLPYSLFPVSSEIYTLK